MADLGYFHAEFRRANPFPGWAPERPVYSEVNEAVNLGHEAFLNNFVILETRG